MAGHFNYPYVVTVRTGPIRNATVDTKFIVNLYGADGETGDVRLESVRPANTQTMVIHTPFHLGSLEVIMLGHDNIHGMGVLIEDVTVLDKSTGVLYRFESGQWIEDDRSEEERRDQGPFGLRPPGLNLEMLSAQLVENNEEQSLQQKLLAPQKKDSASLTVIKLNFANPTLLREGLSQFGKWAAARSTKVLHVSLNPEGTSAVLHLSMDTGSVQGAVVRRREIIVGANMMVRHMKRVAVEQTYLSYLRAMSSPGGLESIVLRNFARAYYVHLNRVTLLLSAVCRRSILRRVHKGVVLVRLGAGGILSAAARRKAIGIRHESWTHIRDHGRLLCRSISRRRDRYKYVQKLSAVSVFWRFSRRALQRRAYQVLLQNKYRTKSILCLQAFVRRATMASVYREALLCLRPRPPPTPPSPRTFWRPPAPAVWEKPAPIPSFEPTTPAEPEREKLPALPVSPPAPLGPSAIANFLGADTAPIPKPARRKWSPEPTAATLSPALNGGVPVPAPPAPPPPKPPVEAPKRPPSLFGRNAVHPTPEEPPRPATPTEPELPPELLRMNARVPKLVRGGELGLDYEEEDDGFEYTEPEEGGMPPDEAAVRIQSIARGKRDRERARKLSQEQRERQLAAIRIQNIARGKRDRERAHIEKLKRESARANQTAAIKVQALARGRRDRRRTADLRAQRENEQRAQEAARAAQVAAKAAAERLAKAEAARAQRQSQDRAAVKVQSLARGRLARKNTAQLKDERELAALKVQALARGRRDRLRVAELRHSEEEKRALAAAQYASDAAALASAAEAQAAASRAAAAAAVAAAEAQVAEDNAAIKMQALARGRRDRRHAARLRGSRRAEESTSESDAPSPRYDAREQRSDPRQQQRPPPYDAHPAPSPYDPRQPDQYRGYYRESDGLQNFGGATPTVVTSPALTHRTFGTEAEVDRPSSRDLELATTLESTAAELEAAVRRVEKLLGGSSGLRQAYNDLDERDSMALGAHVNRGQKARGGGAAMSVYSEASTHIATEPKSKPSHPHKKPAAPRHPPAPGGKAGHRPVGLAVDPDDAAAARRQVNASLARDMGRSHQRDRDQGDALPPLASQSLRKQQQSTSPVDAALALSMDPTRAKPLAVRRALGSASSAPNTHRDPAPAPHPPNTHRDSGSSRGSSVYRETPPAGRKPSNSPPRRRRKGSAEAPRPHSGSDGGGAEVPEPLRLQLQAEQTNRLVRAARLMEAEDLQGYLAESRVSRSRHNAPRVAA